MRAQPHAVRHRSRSRAIDGGMNVRKNTKRYGAVLGVVRRVAVAIERVPLHRIRGCAVEVDGRDGDAAGWSTSNSRTAASSSPASPGSRRPTRSSRSPRTRNSRPSGTPRRLGTRCRAVETNGNDPLHDIDDLVDGTTPAINAGSAAKVIVLVAKPLGSRRHELQSRRRHHEEPRGRAQRRRAAQRFVRHVQRDGLRRAREEARQRQRAGQHRRVHPRRSGSRAAAGTSTANRPANDADVDSTSIAIQALAAAGVAATDADLRAGLAYPRRPPAGRRRVGVVRQPRPELDVDGDLRDHRGRVRSGIAVLAQRRAARAHRAAVHVADGLAAVAAEHRRPDAGRCGPDQQPERLVRRQHVRDDPVDPGVPAGMEPGEPARTAGLPVVTQRPGGEASAPPHPIAGGATRHVRRGPRERRTGSEQRSAWVAAGATTSTSFGARRPGSPGAPQQKQRRALATCHSTSQSAHDTVTAPPAGDARGVQQLLRVARGARPAARVVEDRGHLRARRSTTPRPPHRARRPGRSDASRSSGMSSGHSSRMREHAWLGARNVANHRCALPCRARRGRRARRRGRRDPTRGYDDVDDARRHARPRGQARARSAARRSHGVRCGAAFRDRAKPAAPRRRRCAARRCPPGNAWASATASRTCAAMSITPASASRITKVSLT